MAPQRSDFFVFYIVENECTTMFAFVLVGVVIVKWQQDISVLGCSTVFECFYRHSNPHID